MVLPCQTLSLRQQMVNLVFYEDLKIALLGNRLSSARSKFWGVSGSEDRGGGDNSIQFINIGRVGDKNFKELRLKIGGWKGG